MSDTEVIIFQRENQLHKTLAENLQAAGFRTRTICSTSEITGHGSATVLIADGGPDTDSASEIVQSLIEGKHLHRMPLVLVSQSAESFRQKLAEKFVKVLAIEFPCSLDQLVSVIHEERKSRNTPLSVLFTTLHEMPLKSIKMGGERFNSTDWSTLDLTEEHLQAETIAGQAMLLQIANGGSTRVRRRVNRSAYLNLKILKNLKADETMLRNAREAGLFFYASQAGWHEEDLSVDFFAPGRLEVRAKLSEQAKKGVEELKQGGMEKAAEILVELSVLFSGGSGERARGESNVMAAGAILAADLFHRYCLTHGAFDPHLAKSFLGRIQKGKFSALPLEVLCCLIKLLMEVSSASALRLSVKAVVASNAGHPKPGQQILKVELCALSPGMMITTPIVALDGKPVLPEDSILDPDLIWRLWQIMMVKPLHEEVWIKAPPEK